MPQGTSAPNVQCLSTRSLRKFLQTTLTKNSLHSQVVDRNEQSRCAEVWKECIRRDFEAQQPWQCMACTVGKQEDAFKTKLARPNTTFPFFCKRCEQTPASIVCKTGKDETMFLDGSWKRARRGSSVCLARSREAWGWWRCRVRKIKQASCALEFWLAQHCFCTGDQSL